MRGVVGENEGTLSSEVQHSKKRRDVRQSSCRFSLFCACLAVYQSRSFMPFFVLGPPTAIRPPRPARTARKVRCSCSRRRINHCPPQREFQSIAVARAQPDEIALLGKRPRIHDVGILAVLINGEQANVMPVY